MNKVLIEIKYGFLGDFLEHPDKIAEGLLNIVDPDPRTAETWEIVWVRPPFNKHAELKMSRILGDTEA